MFLNNQQVTEEIKWETKKKFLETNDNENATTQNLWDAAKAVLRGKFIAIQIIIKAQIRMKVSEHKMLIGNSRLQELIIGSSSIY